MKMWKPLAIGIGALVVASATLVPACHRPNRGVRLVDEALVPDSGKFDPGQSAGLFIGVGESSRDRSLDLRNAADDAVDLAYRFSLDPRVRLVPPERVVLALSGLPEKKLSREHLQELKRAGARVETANQDDIVELLQSQAAVVGTNGLLVVALATHGFVKDDMSYVLGADSRFQDTETAVPTARLFEIAAQARALRSLFLIDACRNRIGNGTRGSRSSTAAPLLSRMGNVKGQVVFSAAPAGGYAWNGDGNGVFTKGVLEGLNCKASLRRGVVTFDTLNTSVERYVRKWLRDNRKPLAGAATQSNVDGSSGSMPLVDCGSPPPAPPNDVVRVRSKGADVTALTAAGTVAWTRTVTGPVLSAEVADLDENGSHEVIVGAGAITVFDHTGAMAWSAGHDMPLRRFLIGDLLRTDITRQIVALWADERALRSRVSIYSSDGASLFTYNHAGTLRHLAIERETNRHSRRIIAAGDATVILFDSRRRVWEGICTPSTGRIERLEIIDHGKDGHAIAVSTTAGRLVLDFSGKVIEDSGRARFMLVKGKRR